MSNITKFPNYKLSDIPECLEKLADDIREGRRSGQNCICILYSEEELPDSSIQLNWDYSVFGKSISKPLVIGILQYVSAELYPKRH